MIHTVADLARALKFLGEVEHIGQTSFDIRITDSEPSKTVRFVTTQRDLEERLRTIADDHPEEAWGQRGLTAGEAAGRLLTVHLEELIDNLNEGTQAIVIAKDGISVKGR